MTEESLTIRFLKAIDQYQGLVDYLLETRNDIYVDTELGIDLDAEMHRVRRQVIIAYLKATGGNMTQAAKLLGIAKGTLAVRMHRYGINQFNINLL